MYNVQEFHINLLQATDRDFFEILCIDEKVKVLNTYLDRERDMLILLCLVPLKSISRHFEDGCTHVEDTLTKQTFHLVKSDSTFFEESFEYIDSFTFRGEMYHLFEV